MKEKLNFTIIRLLTLFVCFLIDKKRRLRLNHTAITGYGGGNIFVRVHWVTWPFCLFPVNAHDRLLGFGSSDYRAASTFIYRMC